jgi:DMSO/TMAO reductase YedYZ molybdopterin-dependent catalytic subunit
MGLAELSDRVEAVRTHSEGRQPHDARTASVLGVLLGVTFGICLLTGLWSHLQQHPPDWLQLPVGPTGLYRTTQGLHVMCGLATIPLLLAKLYSVSPQLLRRPSRHDRLDLMERVSVLPLVGGSLFLLVTGAANIARWYPWDFFFPVGHFWAAWLVLGAMIVHVALKAPTLRRSLTRIHDVEPAPAPAAGGLTRRGLLGTVAAAAALLTVTTAGQTVPLLRGTTLLAPRRPDIGPQGLPVNRTAAAARTTDLATPEFRLTVAGRTGAPRVFTLDELRAMPQRTEDLAIACVEGWSATGTWTGIPVADLLRAAGIEPGPVRVVSAQSVGGYRSSELSMRALSDPRCLLALDLNGEPLVADHGAPLRLIAPNRPGVLQTKWVVRVERT